MSDYCSETNFLKKSIARIQECSAAMDDARDRDRAKRTIVHLEGLIDEVELGVKAPAFQVMVPRQ